MSESTRPLACPSCYSVDALAETFTERVRYVRTVEGLTLNVADADTELRAVGRIVCTRCGWHGVDRAELRALDVPTQSGIMAATATYAELSESARRGLAAVEWGPADWLAELSQADTLALFDNPYADDAARGEYAADDWAEAWWRTLAELAGVDYPPCSCGSGYAAIPCPEGCAARHCADCIGTRPCRYA